MTSAHSMLANRPRCAFAALANAATLVALALSTLTVAACSSGPRRVSSTGLHHSPYDRDVIVAVAPFRNESGTGLVDELALADSVVNTLQQVEGISALPVNRTLGAMRALSVGVINDEATAARIAQELGADAIVVGVVTAYDPYNPPAIGLSVALFPAGSSLRGDPLHGLEPRDLQVSPTDRFAGTGWASGAGPLSAVSAHLDASSNSVRDRVAAYAATQSNARSAIGWRRHLASMELYTKFACHELVNRLLVAEQNRMNAVMAGVEEQRHR